MSVILGEGDHRYRLVEDWAKLPDGWQFRDVGAVATDSKDNVYVFNRGPKPMIVFDRDGNYLRAWGDDLFERAHGLHIGPDDMLYCTDDGNHTMRKCTPEGDVLLELGLPGQPAPYMSGEPFHRCTHTALSPDGHIFVSDGYGNARIHKYAPDGKLVMSWGEPGTDPGQFNIVHNIVADDDGWVYVADRENHRVQVFNSNGKYETQWNNMHRPCGLFMPPGRCQHCYIGELGPGMAVNRRMSNIGPRLSIYTHEGELVARLGSTEGPSSKPGRFMSPHGLAVDSRGDIYVGEVAYTNWPSSHGPEQSVPGYLRTLQKFEKLN